MDWIKIEPGCEMTHQGERVLVVAAGPYNDWQEAQYDGEEFDDFSCLLRDVTHWLRMTLPKA